MEFLVRGDTHGVFNWMDNGCLNEYNPENTAIIILGDAGFNYWLDKRDERLKKEVEAKGYTFYCVRGNHEARPQDTLCNYKLIYDENVKGFVYRQDEHPKLNFFMDYGNYYLGDYRIAVFGGAYSVDKWWRLNRAGIYNKLNFDYYNPKRSGWFYNEQLSTEEMQKAKEELGWGHYDFVFTHTCPFSFRPTDLFLNMVNQEGVDSSMERWLDEMKNLINWDVWLFGHYHADRLERPYVEMYYNDIESLETIYTRWRNYKKTGELDWWLTKGPNFYMT